MTKIIKIGIFILLMIFYLFSCTEKEFDNIIADATEDAQETAQTPELESIFPNEITAEYEETDNSIEQVIKVVILMEPTLNYNNIGLFSEGVFAVSYNRNLCGFIDINGKDVVPPGEYDDIRNFSEGLAAVCKDGFWGYIDKNNNMVIPFVYRQAFSFTEGLAAVEDENMKYGFIDKSGNLVVPCIYDYAENFQDGLAKVRIGDSSASYTTYKFGMINKIGEVIIPIEYNRISYSNEEITTATKDFKHGFLNKTDMSFLPLDFDDVMDFSEGLAVVRKGMKYGYIDINGNIVIPVEYDNAGGFNDGLARVWKQGTDWRDRRTGFINKAGEIIIPVEYYSVDIVREGLIVAMKDDGTLGIIDKSNNIVMPFVYSDMQPFNEGIAAFHQNGNWGIMQIVQ